MIHLLPERIDPSDTFARADNRCRFIRLIAGGKFLFASADNQVSGFTISSHGALAAAPGSPTTVRPVFTSPGNEPTGVSAVLDPGARFLFVADATNPAMYVYTVAASGGLTPVAGSPFPTGSSGTAVAVDPEGKFVFIGEAIVTAMSVNQSTGAITPGFTIRQRPLPQRRRAGF